MLPLLHMAHSSLDNSHLRLSSSSLLHFPGLVSPLCLFLTPLLFSPIRTFSGLLYTACRVPALWTPCNLPVSKVKLSGGLHVRTPTEPLPGLISVLRISTAASYQCLHEHICPADSCWPVFHTVVHRGFSFLACVTPIPITSFWPWIYLFSLSDVLKSTFMSRWFKLTLWNSVLLLLPWKGLLWFLQDRPWNTPHDLFLKVHYIGCYLSPQWFCKMGFLLCTQIVL